MTCPQAPSSSLDSLWLGAPPDMLALPIPDAGVQVASTRGGQLRTRADMGQTLVRRPKIKRTWVATWTERQLEEFDLLALFHSGVFGVGPYRLVDPNWRNAFDVDTSTVRGIVGANTQWVNDSGGLPALDTIIAPPPEIGRRSGVLNWAGGELFDFLFPGSMSGAIPAVDTARAVPFIEGADVTASLYVYKPVGGPAFTVRLNLAGVTPDGLWTGTYTQHADTVLADGWQRLSVKLPAGLWLASEINWLALSPIIWAGPSATPAGLRIAAPMISYSSTLDPYVIGYGCPLVNIGDPMSSSASVWEYRTPGALTLAEA